MGIIVEHQKDKNLFILKGKEKVCLDDMVNARMSIIGDSDFNESSSILCDYLEVTEFAVSTEETHDFSKLDENTPLPNSRFAIVAHNSLVFGMSRMWQSVSIESPLNIQVFREMDEALKWLDS